MRGQPESCHSQEIHSFRSGTEDVLEYAVYLGARLYHCVPGSGGIEVHIYVYAFIYIYIYACTYMYIDGSTECSGTLQTLRNKKKRNGGGRKRGKRAGSRPKGVVCETISLAYDPYCLPRSALTFRRDS